jgi:UDP-N-acetylmuramate dehydrogenase
VVVAVEFRLKNGEKAEIRRQIKDYLARRDGQPQEPSAGCIFVNPRPLVAGQLIDQAGLKGKMIGRAKISEKHANFIVNTGGATAKDVVRSIEVIKKNVREKFSVELKEEIQLVGF